jgi:hypothetical protein
MARIDRVRTGIFAAGFFAAATSFAQVPPAPTPLTTLRPLIPTTPLQPAPVAAQPPAPPVPGAPGAPGVPVVPVAPTAIAPVAPAQRTITGILPNSAMVPMQPGQAGGACMTKLSGDRTSIELVDVASRQTRQLLNLGRDRVKSLFGSPDGAWAVAVVQMRGTSRFNAIAIDLAACDQSQAFDLPAAASAAQFGDGVVLLQMPDGSTQLYALKSN